MDLLDEREEELETLSAIYPELVIDENDNFKASVAIGVSPSTGLLIRFVPEDTSQTVSVSYSGVVSRSGAYIERDVRLLHLPPLRLEVQLPGGYPAENPPLVRLSADLEWLPRSKLVELEAEVVKLWEEYGHCQILFTYMDHLQQVAESGFQFENSVEGCLVLPLSLWGNLTAFDEKTRQALFDSGTYDCGVCLEPKKGSSCHKLEGCGHVFCKECLQDFYNTAIVEGDVTVVRCLAPDCGQDKDAALIKRRGKKPRNLHPKELLAMGIEEVVVRRYLEMRRKKKIESDKSTVYCPRTWCQGPAKNPKYPLIPGDISSYVDVEPSDSEEDGEQCLETISPNPKASSTKIPADPTDRLAICEKCSFAFCKVCYMGWHGPFARCYPRDPGELSAEEKASYEYIRLHTSPCPYCASPTQKTMGCNHMICFSCNTHFCYLCGAYLVPADPYKHFNKAGTECYQRLWELEEGDEGQEPADGRGFAGGRGWEQLAIQAAQEADDQEIAEAAQRAENERAAQLTREANDRNVAARDAPIVVAMAQIQLNRDQAPVVPQDVRGANGRQPRNPYPARPAALGAANAVRNHERNAGAQGAARRRELPIAVDNDRQQDEIRRFVALAQRDQEEEWDSDELGDDDDGFVIR